MSLLDPLLLESGLSKYRVIGFFDKLKAINTSYVWFNLILPIGFILITLFFIRMRHQEKKRLYSEYVPDHLNQFILD